MKFYCVKCKKSYEVSKYTTVTTKNGKHAAKATCPVCHTTMFRFVKK